MTSFKVNIQIKIKASKQLVWNALTNPDVIKQYLFGTEAVSDWRAGSELIFRGEYEGTKYLDKGIIKQYKIGEIFQYTYLSSFSGLEDKPENYHLITYKLINKNEQISLILTHENLQNEKVQKHSEKNWEFVLNKIKELTENNNESIS